MALAMGAADVLASLKGFLALGLRHFFTWFSALLNAVCWSPNQSKTQQQQAGSSASKAPRLTVKDIPGPYPVLPVFGTRWIFSTLVGRYSLDKVHEAYSDMFERYGGIVKEEALWNFPVISLREAEDIQKVMRMNSKYPLRPPDSVTVYYRNTRRDLYSDSGVVNEQGETWHRLRTLLTPELTSSLVMQRTLPELNSICDDFLTLVAELKDPESGRLANFMTLARRMGLESICMLTLGQRLGFLDKEISPIAMQLEEVTRNHFKVCRDAFYGFPLWKVFPTSTYRKLVKAEETMYDVISMLVEPAIAQSKDTCPVSETEAQSLLMSILCRPALDMRDKKSAIIDFIAAGIVTLGNSLAFLLYYIATHSDVQKRLYAEISSILQPGEPLTYKILQSATYMKACLQECYRILPTAPIVARITDCDLELSGYHTPAGTVVLCHNWEACNDERNFVHPKQFIPERWLPEEASKRGLVPSAPYLVAPYGFTRRLCPGKKFSELELLSFLAKILQRYEIQCDVQLELQFEFLLGPAGELPFIFLER